MDTIGYSWISEKLGVEPPVPTEKLAVVFDFNNYRSTKIIPGYTKYFSKDLDKQLYDSFGLLDHVLFAVGKEYFSPYLLKKAFAQLEAKDVSKLLHLLEENPTSILLRKTGYLYEVFTDKELNFRGEGEWQKLKKLPVKILPEDKYFTLSQVYDDKYSEKFGVVDNTLGSLKVLSPIVRKTDPLLRHMDRPYGEMLYKAFSDASNDPEIAGIISDRMYIRESQMSFKIEGDTRDLDRITKYNAMLKKYKHGLPKLSKKMIIEMQDVIVPRDEFTGNYRDIQNFIGRSGRADRFPIVDYIPPAPEDVTQLMSGLFDMHEYLSNDPDIDPVVAGSALHLAFTAIHPLSDGNGRISRTLLHDQLARHNYVPENGLIFPVSDIIAAERKGYEDSLEKVTGNIIGHCRYSFDDDGELRATGNDADLYRYLDVTPFAEYLYGAIEKTLDVTVKDIIKDSRFRGEAAKIISRIYPMKEKEKKIFLSAMSADAGVISGRMQKRLKKSIPESALNELMEKIGKLYKEVSIESASQDIIDTEIEDAPDTAEQEMCFER